MVTAPDRSRANVATQTLRPPRTHKVWLSPERVTRERSTRSWRLSTDNDIELPELHIVRSQMRRSSRTNNFGAAACKPLTSCLISFPKTLHVSSYLAVFVTMTTMTSPGDRDLLNGFLDARVAQTA